MKKVIAFIIILALTVGFISGCNETAKIDDDKIKIVVTTFPQYDWVKNILGELADKAEITLLIDNGVDLHSYQPSTDDIIKISTSDLFLYIGGPSDSWTEDVLKNAVNKDMKVISLIEVLGDAVKEEEVKEGMEDDDDHDHESGHDHDERETDTEFDEHVWLSLRNATILSEKIADALAEIDPDNAETYINNSKTYIEKISALDKRYEEAVKNAKHNTVVFADRFPFRYLVDDYGFNYFAAFVGCSAETEASFDTIVFLANKIDELSLEKILIIETSDGSVAKTVKNSTNAKNQEVLALDSIQSVSKDEIASGTTYLSIMESNLEVLKKALGSK